MPHRFQQTRDAARPRQDHDAPLAARLKTLCETLLRRSPSREGTGWEKVLRLRTLYRLPSPGSEWRLPRHWFGTTALADRLDADERLAPDDTLYRGLDGLRAHQDALFAHRHTPRP